MKHILTNIIALLFCIFLTTKLDAALPVVDGTSIAVNLTNAKKDLLEQILQEGNQRVQIEKMISQIQKADQLLNELGKLKDVKDLPGFAKEAEAFLREVEINLPSFKIIKDIKGEELFKEERNSPYKKINKNILIDGKKVATINTQSVTPELASRRTVAHYHHVKTKVLTKRALLKGELETAMLQLKKATTTAQVQKLTAVINALNVQVAATDADLSFAHQEVVTRYYQNKIEESIQKKVQVQKERASLKEGMKKHFEFFQLPNQPTLFKSNR